MTEAAFGSSCSDICWYALLHQGWEYSCTQYDKPHMDGNAVDC